MFRTCLVAFLAVIVVADVQEDEGVQVAEIGVRHIKAHSSLSERGQSLMRRDPLSPADAQKAEADANNKAQAKSVANAKSAADATSSVREKVAANAEADANNKAHSKSVAHAKTAAHAKSAVRENEAAEAHAKSAKSVAHAKSAAHAKSSVREKAAAVAKATARAKAQAHVRAKVDNDVMPSHMYKDAINASGVVAYWPLNEPDGATVHGFGPACGPEGLGWGDACQADALLKTPTDPVTLNAGCLLGVCGTLDNSIHFGGTDQLIAIPSNPYLNLETEGYPEKTVELWMRPELIDQHKRIVFAMGRGNHSGISIYVKKDDDAKDKLFMFAWNQVEFDTHFGMDDPPVNQLPLKCEIHPDKVYYVAFVFKQSIDSYIGYIKPEDSADVQECGRIEGLPANSKLGQMASGGHPCVAGVAYDTRFDGSTEGQDPYGFKGKIQFVAMYNTALEKTSLEDHVTAANGR